MNLESYYSTNKILELVRTNIFAIILVSAAVVLVDYKNFFGGPNEIYYVIATAFFLSCLAVFVDRYLHPFRYDPPYFLFVKDRDEELIRMEPTIDKFMTGLGFIKPEEFVNVRYTVYPELDVGLDMDPTTGLISGYPLNIGNHNSVVKMKFLGGEYSTKVRVEVVDTVRDRVPKTGEKFAPPRTVAQLLTREEDLILRERELDSRFDEKRKEMEAEYSSRWRSLDEKFEVERLNFSDTLEHTEAIYQKKLDEKDSRIEKLEDEMISSIQAKENEFLERQKDLMDNLKASEERVSELELLAVETGAAAANLEEEYIEMFDTLATGKTSDVDTQSTPQTDISKDEMDYVSMSTRDLKKLAKERSISTSGTKEQIISRLEES